MRYFTFTKYAIEMRRFRIQRELQHQPMDYNKYKFISTISAVHSVGVEWEHSCLKCSYARNNVQVKNLQGFQKDTNSGSRNKQLHVYLTHNAKYDHFHLQSFIAETSFLAGTNRQHFQGFWGNCYSGNYVVSNKSLKMLSVTRWERGLRSEWLQMEMIISSTHL